MPITQDIYIPMGKPLSDTDFDLPKLNAGVKEQWVTALRSGEFPQTTGALKQLKSINSNDPNDKTVGYCCLGVLCEIAVKNEIIPAGVQPHITEQWVETTYKDTGEVISHGHWVQLPEEEQIPKGFWNFDGGSDMPGHETKGWAGLPDQVAKYLAHKNDNGATFGEIADFIEREL